MKFSTQERKWVEDLTVEDDLPVYSNRDAEDLRTIDALLWNAVERNFPIDISSHQLPSGRSTDQALREITGSHAKNLRQALETWKHEAMVLGLRNIRKRIESGNSSRTLVSVARETLQHVRVVFEGQPPPAIAYQAALLRLWMWQCWGEVPLESDSIQDAKLSHASARDVFARKQDSDAAWSLAQTTVVLAVSLLLHNHQSHAIRVMQECLSVLPETLYSSQHSYLVKQLSNLNKSSSNSVRFSSMHKM